MTYIKDRKEKIETDIAGVDEKIKVNEDDADANNCLLYTSPLPFSDKEADASIPVRKDDPKDWRYQRSMKAAVRDRHRGKQTHHDRCV